MRFIKPLDEALLHKIFQSYTAIVTLEDGTIKGGFGSAVLEFAAEHNYKNPVKILGIPDVFIEHASTTELQHLLKLDADSLSKTIEDLLFVIRNH